MIDSDKGNFLSNMQRKDTKVADKNSDLFIDIPLTSKQWKTVEQKDSLKA
jgi:hypothetical protein